jgi:hypothetical protein
MSKPAMKIWRLTPIELADPDWRASTYHEPVTVRAPDGIEARFACMWAFGIAVERNPGTGASHAPWLQSRLARCEELHGSGWSTDGPTTILDPALRDEDLAVKIATIGVAG